MMTKTVFNPPTADSDKSIRHKASFIFITVEKDIGHVLKSINVACIHGTLDRESLA